MYLDAEVRKNFSLLSKKLREELTLNAISGEGFGDYNQLFNEVNLDKPSWKKI